MNNFTKTLIVALLLSIGIHFMIYYIIDKNLQNKTLNINTTNKINTASKNGYVKIKYVKIVKEKKIAKKKKTPAIVKKKSTPSVTLPTIKKETLDLKKFFTIQKQEKIEKEDMQKKAIDRQKEIEEIQQLSALTQDYIKLYGEQYFEFSKYHRRYLKQNLNKIGQITQRYLKYPNISIRTQQKGINIVEFYLHPNGDITDLKLSDSSYYTALDTNTIDTIKIAYQDYPKPLEKVKIKIFVKYILY